MIKKETINKLKKELASRKFLCKIISQQTKKQYKYRDLSIKSDVWICPCQAFSRRAVAVCAA